MTQDERTYKLASESIPKLLIHYTLPAIVGTMVNALYNVVDRIFIGQGVGTDAITGLAITFPILIFMQAFGMLIGAGASARVSILLGEGNNDRAERILGNAILLTFVTQAMTIIPAMIFMEPLLKAFGASPAALPYAEAYLKILLPGNIFSTLAFGYSAIMRASGYPYKSMTTMLIGAITNTCLDALFIYGFGWGIAGAAWATVIAMATAALYVMRHFFDRNSLIRFRKKNLRFSWTQIMAIISIGIAPFSVQILGSVTAVIFNKTFISYSANLEEADLAIAAYAILNSFAMIGVMLMLGIAQGMQPIVGFNYGARNIKRVSETFRLGVLSNITIALVFLLLAVFVPRLIARLFTTDQELIDISATALRISLLGFVPVAFQVTATQFFQSLGMGMRAMLLSISRQILFLVPLLLTLPNFYGIKGVWLTMPISDTCSGVLGVIMITLQFRWFRKEQELEGAKA